MNALYLYRCIDQVKSAVEERTRRSFSSSMPIFTLIAASCRPYKATNWKF